MIDGKVRSANVVALTDTSLAAISRGAFWDVMRRYPAVAEVVLKRLTRLVRLYSDRMYEFSTSGVRNRIHAELLRMAAGGVTNENTAIISPMPTHAEIANRISTRREAVARELADLARDGVVTRGSKMLKICDLSRLERMVDGVRGR